MLEQVSGAGKECGRATGHGPIGPDCKIYGADMQCAKSSHQGPRGPSDVQGPRETQGECAEAGPCGTETRMQCFGRGIRIAKSDVEGVESRGCE
ncbi:hypothetical protein K438DRAFT_805004 [Mycena galopus ATCC 62051]|nr:hypothetical protein K438DRAFT_805004 [Mycena galopus ATCC 62051]